MKEPIMCPHCGKELPANYMVMKSYWVPLRPGIIRALIKFRAAVVANNRNSIHLLKDMSGTRNELTRHEWNNFSRLRFHAMVAKVREEGLHKSGYWLLTKRGASFLKGEIAVPAKVLICRNEVIDHDFNHLVDVRDVMGFRPAFETIDDIEYEIVTPEQAELQL